MHVPRWGIAMQAVAGVVVTGAAVAPAHAQSRGSVAGTITDVAGVPTAGAQVTLRDRGVMRALTCLTRRRAVGPPA